MPERRLGQGFPAAWPTGKTKFFTLTMDDLSSQALTFLDELEALGCRAAFGFGMSYIDESLGDDQIKARAISFRQVQLIQQRGHEIAYHGYIHPDLPLSNRDTIDEDRALYDARLATLNGEHTELPPVRVYGYMGPNNIQIYPTQFSDFWWARPAGNSYSYGGGVYTTDYGLVDNTWIDNITQAQVDSIVATAQGLAAGQWINLSVHTHTAAEAGNWALISQLLTRLQTDAEMVCCTPVRALRRTVFSTGNIGSRTTLHVVAKLHGLTSSYGGVLYGWDASGEGGWDIVSETGVRYQYGVPVGGADAGRIVFYGDSITCSASAWGYQELVGGNRVQVETAYDYPAQLAKLFGRRTAIAAYAGQPDDAGFDNVWLNFGESGANSRNISYMMTGHGVNNVGRRDFLPYLDSVRAVCLLAGYNDHNMSDALAFAAAVPEAVFDRSRYDCAIAALMAGGAVTVGGTVISDEAAYYARFSERTTGQLAYMCEWAHAHAPGVPIILLTMYTGMETSPNYAQYATISAENVARNLTYVTLARLDGLSLGEAERRDGLHPNLAGAEKIAQAIYATVAEAAFGEGQPDVPVEPDPPLPPVTGDGVLYLIGGAELRLSEVFGIAGGTYRSVWRIGGTEEIRLYEEVYTGAELGRAILGTMILGKAS